MSKNRNKKVETPAKPEAQTEEKVEAKAVAKVEGPSEKKTRFDLFVGGVTLLGYRKNNEDHYGTFAVDRGDRSMAVLYVADGLGGEENGELASAAVGKALPALIEGWLAPHADFKVLFEQLNQAVSESQGYTTLTLLVLDRRTGRFALAWAGDSPGFVLRRAKESKGAEAAPLGESPFFPLAQIKPHGFQAYVSRQLGKIESTDAHRRRRDRQERGEDCPPWEPDVIVGDVAVGDVFLLSSDGLDPLVETNKHAIDPPPFSRTLEAFSKLPLMGMREPVLDGVAERLAEAALAAGGTDNTTVIVGVVHAGKGRTMRVIEGPVFVEPAPAESVEIAIRVRCTRAGCPDRVPHAQGTARFCTRCGSRLEVTP